jgi:hypothetical protein
LLLNDEHARIIQQLFSRLGTTLYAIARLGLRFYVEKKRVISILSYKKNVSLFLVSLCSSNGRKAADVGKQY